MKKIIISGLTLIAVFCTTLLLLRQVDWMKVFKVEQTKEQTVQQLGKLIWELFEKTEKENKDAFVRNALDSMVNKICLSNGIDRTVIKLHVLEKDEINAFALPDGHLVIYSGLIAVAESPEALSGVIAHEIAHIEQNHVMKKLMKELGLSVITSMASGGSGTAVIKKAAKMLSSTSFDRSLEKEADIKATDYLIQANIDPKPFADFLYQLADSSASATKYLSRVSTHPESKERAAYILNYSKSRQVQAEPVLSPQTWTKLKEKSEE